MRPEICSSFILDVNSWHMVPEILSRISAPIFPDRDFDITSYGAVPNGITDSTEAFRRAIAECNLLGGGRVIVPPVSIFYTHFIVKAKYFTFSFIRVSFYQAQSHF